MTAGHEWSHTLDMLRERLAYAREIAGSNLSRPYKQALLEQVREDAAHVLGFVPDAQLEAAQAIVADIDAVE